MQKPIGIVQAAIIANTTRRQVHIAMERGDLAWKLFDGHQATTQREIRCWLATAR